MSYTFLDIKQGSDGNEYAYLLDEDNGYVVKRLVVEGNVSIPAQKPKSIIPPVIPFKTSPEAVPNTVMPLTPVPTFHGMPLPDDAPASADPHPAQTEMPRMPSMIPPGMNGVFLEHDTPGSAVETRRTL